MSHLIVFLATQMLLPFWLGHIYCQRKGIPTGSWRAGGVYLIAVSLAMVLFIGVLGLPTHVKNVGFVSSRSMGFTCGGIGIAAGLVMGFIARHLEHIPGD